MVTLKCAITILDLKQEIQVLARQHTDNDKSAAVDRVCNHVDSNKLQAELDSHTPPTSPMNTTTPLKSKMRSALHKTKLFFVRSKKRSKDSSNLPSAVKANSSTLPIIKITN